MTIYLLTGTPGSGKSYHMAEWIYYDVKHGRRVIANFDVNTDLFDDSSSFTYLDDDELQPGTLYGISRDFFGDEPVKEGKISLFIDECAVYFNARSWGDKSRKDWIKFFTQHRKLGYDVYLITQFDTMIDKQVRALIEYEYKHRKLNNLGWVGKLATLLFLGHPVFVNVLYWYPMKQRLSARWSIGRKKFYRMYDTYLVFEGNEIAAT